MGHESPIEHASFTFGIEGVSRSFLAQITRHRIASYSVKSQRYVSEAHFEYVVPPEIDAVPEAKEEFLRAMEEDQRHYDRIAALLKERHKAELVAAGEDAAPADRAAEKQANEDARFVLPNACETKLICTFDARSLLHFFSLRCCNRAQWEIRSVAVQMLRLARQAAPHLFREAGPPCLRGGCTEGRMSCGRAEEVRKFFREMETE
jgi:thymidylate synthase (FAD)